MLAQTVILASLAALAQAGPALQARTTGTVWHYGVVENAIVSCPGISLPASGIYAAVQTGAAAAPCGTTISITDSLTGKTLAGIPVVGTYANGDSSSLAATAVQVSEPVFDALGTAESFVDFPATWSFT